MKMTLKPIQSRILVKLGTARRLSFNRLAEVAMPSRKLNPESRSRWDSEIRLQIELLGLYGLIHIEEQLGIRTCIAPEFVVSWVPEYLGHLAAMRGSGRKPRASIVRPLIAASLVVAATTACSHLPGMKQHTPAPVVSPYNSAGTPPPERMEQFYNPRSNTMVYRFCVGAECPEPTPKKPKPGMALVNEIDSNGHVSPIDASIVSSIANRAPHPSSLPVTETQKGEGARMKAVSSDKGAALAAQLDQQRRAILEASGAAQAPTAPPAAAKWSMKPLEVPVTNQSNKPGTQDAVGPVRKDKPPLQEMLPSTGTRVPNGPQARTELPQAPKLAKLTGGQAVGGMAQPEMVTETTISSNAPVTAGTPEAFLIGWAELWSAKKADAFFGLYANDFFPTYGDAKSFVSFEQQRRNVMIRSPEIKVEIEVVKVEEKEGKATIRFWQHYASKSFKSRVMKSLELVKVDGDWRIRRERLIPVLQNAVA